MVNLTSVSCELCDASTVNAYICTRCESRVKWLIIRAGITYEDDNHGTVFCLLDELDTQISRQSRTVPRQGSRSSEVPLPFDPLAAKAHSALAFVLSNSAQRYGAYGADLSGPRRSAHWLEGNVSKIILHSDIGITYHALDDACVAALHLIDRAEARDYIGICSAPTPRGQCTVDLYATQGVTSISCKHCGTVHDIQARRLVLLDAAQEVLLNATDMVRAIGAYGVPVTRGQIYKWRFSGRLTTRGLDTQDGPRYRVGDVLQLAQRKGLHSRRMED